jgi:hypothetical protein
MIKKLYEAQEKYPSKTVLKGNRLVWGDLWIDHKTKTIKSEHGWGVIYDFKTGIWAEKEENASQESK